MKNSYTRYGMNTRNREQIVEQVIEQIGERIRKQIRKQIKNKIKNGMKKGLLVLLVIAMLIPSNGINVLAANSSKMSVEAFIKLFVQATKLTVNSTESNPYITAALREGLIKEGEFTYYSVNIKKEDAAVIADRADELLYGTSYDKQLYNQIITNKRISDLSKITKSKQDSVVKLYAKGIMIGTSNGRYTHSRKFNGKDYLSIAEAKLICNRVVTLSKRRKMSQDGQLIRTTNLPKNYKSYEYILEAFPNSFYEKKFRYQKTKYYYDPVELVDYACPAKIIKMNFNGYDIKDVLETNLDAWAKKIEINLETRLNADYRTIDNTWLNRLRKTYFIYNNADMDKQQTKAIKNYIKTMKKNKVVIKGIVSVEPSTLYFATGFYMRAYIKFKVTSAINLKTEEDVIFGNTVYIPKLVKNTWYVMYIDIGLGSNNGSSSGEDYGIFSLDDTLS